VTTYPVPVNDRAAKTIKDLQNRVRVAEHRANKSDLKAGIAHANVNSLMAQVKTLQQQVENLFTKIGDPSQNGSGLTNVQSTFLATLSQMTTPASYPLADDPTSGSTWASGERAYVNSSIDQLNSIVQKLQRNGLMHT
jgi:hypothetical protein